MVRVFLAAVAAALVAIDAKPFFLNDRDIVERIETQDGGHLESAQIVNEEWFEQQLLDHGRDGCGDGQVWKQRYFTNSEFYGGPGSPVFLYINGENVARNTTVVSKNLFMNILAKKHNALIVSLEHRYYGKSQPTTDLSTSNLKYLSADNALADIATFQDYFTANRNLSSNSPWVAFGGSYPGMLSAWTKFSYPNRFVGSVASSAPIELHPDYFEYMEVVGYGLKYFGGEECVNTLSEGLKAFHALVASEKPEDVAQLKKLFNPCAPIKSDLDRMDIESNVMGAYQNFAQNNDWDTYVLKDACADLNAKDGLTPLEKVAKINARSYPACTGSSYQNDIVDALSNPARDTVGIMRQWIYQTCTEFGFGQTAKKSKSPFSALEYVNVERVYYQMCKDVYGITDPDPLIAAKKAHFQGLDIDVENVVFPSGTIDPWSALAPSNSTHLKNPKSSVVYIEGTSHCRDMNAPRATDSGHIVWAHQQIENSVAKFLQK
ncbi:serine protease family S28 [Thraustotheca clavata]|uniref:Secreted protein n=1 Tax=Thraustotheca clavata TaxID=74557 RepID=A0A0A7CMT7_9STRA|nr:secreted protein [Thraustotheca clavata]OQR82188.1 serine protease family S28 [Thraustotheca clavata]